MGELSVQRGGVALAGEQAGEGIPVVLLHGLTATRRYVVMGSRVLERAGHRVIAYDARGHGRSDPAQERRAYDYVNQQCDLVAVLDEAEVQRAVLAGASMGAHTALRMALERPERVAALAVITPAHDPQRADEPGQLARWDRLADGLRAGGIEGFVQAYGVPDVPERWRQTVLKVIRQRLAEHRHLGAVADAMQAVARSRPFQSFDELEAIEVPAVVVASGDEADPGHPYAVGQRIAGVLPRGRLVSEPRGESPVAWQGGRASRLIAEVASEAAREGLIS